MKLKKTTIKENIYEFIFISNASNNFPTKTIYAQNIQNAIEDYIILLKNENYIIPQDDWRTTANKYDANNKINKLTYIIYMRNESIRFHSAYGYWT